METFTTSKGYQIEFFGIATLMDKLNASRKVPKVPTYTVPTAAGVIEIHEHTETTLETDEEKAAYADYIKARDAELAEFNVNSLKMILLKGIRVINPPTDDAWEKEQQSLGIEVPVDPVEKKFHFIYTEVVGNLDDLNAITNGVQEASGVSEERISQTADLFRHSVEGSQVERRDGQPADNNGALDVHQSVRTSESGNQNADDTKPVRHSKHR